MLRRTLAAAVVGVPALVAQAHAQGPVTGTVVDRQTGAPVVGATVVITGTTTGTVTDAAGAFALGGTGARPLTIRSAGYLAVEVSPPEGRTPLRVRLTPARNELPGVQVVGTRTAPGQATLTQAELQRASGVRLEDALNTVPGAFMQSRTPFGGARVTLRGYYPSTSGNSANANGLGYQVLLNDIPVTDATGTTVLDDIDFARLARVDVFKGPATTQYGSFTGGTLLFTTARPQAEQTSLVQQVEGGSYGLRRTTTSFETATANSDAVVDYAHQGYDAFRPHSGSRKEYVHATGDMNLGDTQTLSAYFSYNRSFEELAGEIDSLPFYGRQALSNAAYLANDSHIQLNSYVAGVTDQIRFAGHFTNRTTVFGTGRTSGQPFAHGFTDVNQTNVGARTAFGFADQWGRVGVSATLGALAQRSNLTSNGVFIVPAPPYPERPTAQQNYASTASLFTEWNVALPAEVTVTVGASLNRNRFSIHNLLRNGQLFDTTQTVVRTFDAVVTPRAAIAKAFGTAGSLYASVGTGYTPPLLGNVVDNTGAVNLALKPERAVQYELGGQAALFANRLTAQASVFDIENTDKLVSQTVSSVTSTVNAGRQRNRGAEVSLGLLAVDAPTAAITRVRPWASWAYTDARFVDFKSDANNTARTVDYAGNSVPRVPKNQLSAGLDVGTRVGAYLTSTYQRISRVPVTFDNSTYVRGYDLLGAKVGVRRPLVPHWGLDAFVGADNLTRSTAYSFLFVGPTYAGLATAAAGGTGDGYIIPAPYGTQYYANVSLRYTF